jgi:hypothetical protein
VPKVSLSFELNRSHILLLNKLEVKVDETTMVEKVIEVKPVKKVLKPKKVNKEDKEKLEDADKEAKKEETEEEVKKEETEEEVKKEEGDEDFPVPEKVMEEKVIPHSYPFTVIDTKLNNVRLIEGGKRALAVGRMRALEKRDEDKKKNDAAKNDFESLVLEFRSWLNDDDN